MDAVAASVGGRVGAIAAVLCGFTGLVMNNRFGDNAWPQRKSEESGRLVIEVPGSAGASPKALAAWLREVRGLDARVGRKSKPSQGRLAGCTVLEPARWNLSGGTGGSSWSLQYVPGKVTAEVKRSRHGPFAVVTRLHKGVGGGWAWNLLADSLAIGMVLLGLSGTRRQRADPEAEEVAVLGNLPSCGHCLRVRREGARRALSLFFGCWTIALLDRKKRGRYPSM